MNQSDGFDRIVSDWLHEQAGRGAPAYLDEVLARTTRTRQRPAWSSLERWLPVEATLRFAPVPRIAWLLVVLALLAALAVAILTVGSPQRLPEPFGLARNGSIVYEAGGDIYLADPVTGTARPIIAGPELDSSPVFSLQGTRLAFLRKADATDLGNGGDVNLLVADSDGRHVVQVAGPIRYEDRYGDSLKWSPDGSVIAIGFASAGDPQIVLAASNGDGARVLDVGMPAHSPSWRPTDGAQLLFWANSPREGPGLYLVQADGQGLQRLDLPSESEFSANHDFLDTSWSPDGARLAYGAANFGPVGAGSGWRVWIHVAEVSPSGSISSDTKVQLDSRSDGESLPRWSPDGQRILFQMQEGDSTLLAVAPADGLGSANRIASTAAQILDPNEARVRGFSYEWAPDSSAIVWLDTATGTAQILDTDVDASQPTQLGILQSSSWQRLAR